jgi:hypothetical protein
VSVFVTVTVAFTTTAPLESVTVPEILPPTPAQASTARKRTKKRDSHNAGRLERLNIWRQKSIK